MIKSIAIIFLLFSTFLFSKPLKIVTNEDNPPFSFKLPDETITGLYVEFWQLWALYNQQEVIIEVQDFEESLQSVRYYGAIHAGLFSSSERRKWAEFSLPIHQVETGVLLSRKHKSTTLLRDFEQNKVAVQEASYQANYLKNNYPKLQLIYFTNPEEIFNLLLNNEIDAIVAEIPFIKAELGKLGLIGVLELSDEILMKNLVHAMLAKGNSSLLKTINNGILNIPVAEIIKLEKKWLPNSAPFFSQEENIPYLTSEENQWLKSHRSFSLGIDTSWYPFDFIDEKGQFSGIAADYMNYLSEALNIHFSPEYERKWTDSFELFNQGQIDIISAIIATEERIKTINFTDAYFKAPTVIVTQKDSFYVEDMNSLLGRKLGLVKGFAIVELVKNDFPEIDIELVDSIVQGLTKLDNGKIDAYLGTLAVINYEIDKRGFDHLKIAAFSPYRFEISMAIRKGLEPLVSILNKSFNQMSEKQKASIANDWLAIHIATGTQLTTIVKWSLPILTLFILIIVVISRYNKNLQIQIQQRKNAEKELLHIAEHDSLTGLPNWRNFESQYTQLLSNNKNSKHAILFLDLDGFKNVNDTYGHQAGDEILIQTAQRLDKCVENLGFLARVGGDEFVVLFKNIKDRQQIKDFSQSIIRSISQSFDWQGNQVDIGTSIGISLFPDDSDKLDELVKNADTAMYKAKEYGKNNYKFC